MPDYLLDTHALIWLHENNASLPETIRQLFGETESILYVSIATLWEMQIKVQRGKLNVDVNELWEQQQHVNDLVELAVKFKHVKELGQLPLIHGDPFDRILIAQARVEQLTLLSSDKDVQSYDVKWLWS